MKKSICLLILVGLLLGGLSACGKADDEEEEGSNEIYVDKKWEMYEDSMVTSDVTIKFSTLHAATSKQGTAVQALVDNFNNAQQAKTSGGKITVEVEFGDGKGVDQNTKLWAAYPAKSNADCAYVGASSIAMYNEMTLDLRRVFTYDQIRDFDEGLLQYSMYNGKFLSVPFAPSSNVLMVNKELWESKGATLPTVDSIVSDPSNSAWTWENFKANCIALKDDANGIYGFGTNAMDEYGMMYQQGGCLYDIDMKHATFNNSYGIKALEYWRSLATSGAMKIKTNAVNTDLNIVNDFKDGKVAAIWQSTSSIKSNLTNATDAGFTMVVMPFPRDTTFYANQGGNGMIIFNNKSELRTAAAATFVRFMNSAESVATLAEMTGYFPTTKSAKATDTIKELYENNPLTYKASSQLLVFGKPAPQGVAKAAVDSKFSAEVKQIFDNPDKDIATILRELSEEIQYTLDTSN